MAQTIVFTTTQIFKIAKVVARVGGQWQFRWRFGCDFVSQVGVLCLATVLSRGCSLFVLPLMEMEAEVAVVIISDVLHVFLLQSYQQLTTLGDGIFLFGDMGSISIGGT